MIAKAPVRHFHELDSLRGLAALTVLLGHYSNLFLTPRGPYAGIKPMIEAIYRTPFFVLISGHEAVMLFFVLSGFVLSLQFLKGRPVPYGPFLIKRLFRIYVPYLVVLALAVAACAAFFSGSIADLGPWFNTPWSAPITLRSIIDHVIFLHDFKSDQYDPVLWSLVHELRISIAFPLLMALVMKRSWRGNLILSGALSVFGIVASLAWIKLMGFETDYLITFHYAGVFILGFLLARHREEILSWHTSLSSRSRLAIALMGFVFYCYGHLLPWKLNYFQDVVTAWGAALLVLTALGSARTSAFLHLPPVKFLGKVSYSLYLLHAVIVLSLTHLLYGKLPIGVILGLSLGLSLLLSHLSYEWIEAPAMRAGRMLADRLGSSTWGRAGTPMSPPNG
jgi:peptidoglycan/LPS O-acetylase OafA/YrhL